MLRAPDGAGRGPERLREPTENELMEKVTNTLKELIGIAEPEGVVKLDRVR